MTDEESDMDKAADTYMADGVFNLDKVANTYMAERGFDTDKAAKGCSGFYRLFRNDI